MRISDWSSDVCSSDLLEERLRARPGGIFQHPQRTMPAREVEAAELREARRLLIGAGRGEAAVQCLGQRERQTLGEHRTPRRCQHENKQTKPDRKSAG